VFALLACVSFALALPNVLLQNNKQKFIEFQQTYNRVYPTATEFQKRFQIFQDNMLRAAELTKLNKGSATFGVNEFADVTPEEFARTHLMPNYKKKDIQSPSPVKTIRKPKVGGPDPSNWNWAAHGVVTPVYNQGQCGSCWAFSATETIESYAALSGLPLTGLSMEQICDCDTTDGGCNGGNTNTAYQYVESAHGLDTLANYPYTAGGGNTGTCQFPEGKIFVDISGFTNINGETGLYQQASTSGPVSVCVDASSWQSYTGGILTTCTNNIDHCVQLTGYQDYTSGSSNPQSAWIVRNSWGASWGESGYIRIQTGLDLCAIGDDATVVTIGGGNSTTGHTSSTSSGQSTSGGATGASSTGGASTGGSSTGGTSGGTGTSGASTGSTGATSGSTTANTSGSTGSTGTTGATTGITTG